MYFKFFYFIIILLYSFSSAHPVSYEEAYTMEKEDPLFSIPLYEELLRTSKKSDIRKTASSRLFFLYEKYRKYVPAILIMIRSGKITDKKGRYPSIINELADGLNVSPSALVSVISGCNKPISNPDIYFQETNPPQTEEESVSIGTSSIQTPEPVVVQEIPFLFKILSKKENASLYKVCYAVKIKTGDYDGWEKIHAFGEMKGIINPQTSLALRISFTIHSGRGSAYKRIYSGGRLKSLNEEGKSDLLYLYGKFLRNLGKYDSSARYFWMSGSYASKDRSAIETAKTLLISGRKQEACSYLTKGFFPGDESEELLSRVCFKNFENTHPGQGFLKAIKILNNDIPDPVFEYFLGKGISDKIEEPDTDHSNELPSSYGKLLDEKLFSGEKNPTPFWDYRKKEGTLFLSAVPRFLCKSNRSSLFKKDLIQPQNCVPYSEFSTDAILTTPLFESDQEEWSLILSNAAYNPISGQAVFADSDGVETSLQMSNLVYRKSLNRFFIDGFSGDKKYKFYSIDLKKISVNILNSD
ncbi:hypothetical protein [Leptospira borgpetersenii]|uniref:Uncharacterized protein n=2 Tax=Leptospira borgpetersenii serovar Hardjo-bovis TaxID=338217 RepID=Q04PX8_LEPBJ|nr:hypothetical protein [Leptospira borgpetersenii]ABJ77042.1 Hypothetical protein LBJ_2619 [Leptospira borgpetersenii serovar Hardjo-bovis str. JB197]ABJ78092.1 Hypothetical protein LBL_0497 [Leptospira borgpetersenii serovar Hardjo-bovis str. L550]AMX57288.1 hypothetical protein LBK6_02495 [Leptospira borgpetersenii serovar Hardjo]AMX60519.1 hypothetical protein LBK9_02430 [Leptospira borgpetersenii serovar Hardjo]AMX63765.1 hypothetical protein LBK30_02490 [Leptospira borgpetersenii serovar